MGALWNKAITELKPYCIGKCSRSDCAKSWIRSCADSKPVENRTKVPGVETNTGPLGHGLPVAVGMAKAAKLSKADWKTYVITGDGEMQEGSNWEAAMAAAKWKLDNFTVILDRNHLQNDYCVKLQLALIHWDQRTHLSSLHL